MQAMDVSSHQPRDLTQLIADHKPALVIVKLYLPWESISVDHTIRQVESAQASGCLVGGYVWGYHSVNPQETITEAIRLARIAGISLSNSPAHPGEILWLDCEMYSSGHSFDRGPDAAWLLQAREQAERMGIVLGLYTAQWWWSQYMDNTTEFGDMPLWAASYMHDTRVETVPEFGGWTHESGHIVGRQYTNDPVDMNTFLELEPTMSESERILHAMWAKAEELQRMAEALKQDVAKLKVELGIP